MQVNKDQNRIVLLLIGGLLLFFVLMILTSGKISPVFVGLAVYLVISKLNNYLINKPMATINLNPNTLGSRFIGGTKKALLAFLGAVALAWLLISSIVVIDAGTVGVYSLFGKVRSESLQPGFHIVNPFASIIRMSVRTEEYTMSRSISEGRKTGDDSIAALTKEGLNVSLDMTALYHLDNLKAHEVYKTLGLDYDEKVVRPEIRSAIRGVVAQYDAKDLYSAKRDEANQKIFDGLKSALDPRGIILETVLIRDVLLPANLTQAIQEKLAADQEAQKYDFILDKEKKEKQRKIIEAEGQRDAQKIINESLSDKYLYYQYIVSLKDRQGTVYVPTSPTSGMPLFRDVGK